MSARTLVYSPLLTPAAAAILRELARIAPAATWLVCVYGAIRPTVTDRVAAAETLNALEDLGFVRVGRLADGENFTRITAEITDAGRSALGFHDAIGIEP